MKKLVVALCGVALAVVVCRGWDTPMVKPLVLSRGSFEPFKVSTDPQSVIDFSAKAKTDLDIVVRQHDYDPGANTGWHTHPGPVFITVTDGTLTFYEFDDPTCTPKVVTAGHGYVDSGRGHIAFNETSLPARDISVIIAPPAPAGFRGPLGPSRYCRFPSVSSH